MQLLQDSVTLFPSDDPSITNEERILVIFIAGNPGLIEYYRDYLTQLQSTLATSGTQSRNIVFHGVSLLGFELSGRDENRPKEPPYTLRETIDGVKRTLLQAVGEYGGAAIDEKQSKPTVKVVLIGHSIGAYILLEIVDWWRKVQAGEAEPKKGMNGAVGANSAMKIVGGVCLFPTIVDIAKSPRAQIVEPLLLIPGISIIVSILTRLVLLLVPTWLLSLVLSVIIRMDRPAANITAAWLKSAHGVRQTVFLGQHELKEVLADRWSADVWGVKSSGTSTDSSVQTASKSARAKLFFFWGDHDHWVDNARRDRLIATRIDQSVPQSESLPRMEIDQTGLPHAFCVKAQNTKTVAAKTATWIAEMV